MLIGRFDERFRSYGQSATGLWLDNVSAAVKRVLRDGYRELTEEFLRFKHHYGFNTTFCNRGKGKGKGNVESKVGYHGPNMFVPAPSVDDLKALGLHLLEEVRPETC